MVKRNADTYDGALRSHLVQIGSEDSQEGLARGAFRHAATPATHAGVTIQALCQTSRRAAQLKDGNEVIVPASRSASSPGSRCWRRKRPSRRLASHRDTRRPGTLDARS